jgi:hypothetical protein
MRFDPSCALRTVAAVAVVFLTAQVRAEEPAPAVTSVSVSTLVADALQSEVLGRGDQRRALLEQALTKSPDEPAAQWHMGRVYFDGCWRTPEAISQLSSSDARLGEYAKLRAAAGTSAESHVVLARWCRKNRLSDEERAHWLAVLRDQPGNAEAIKALRLQPFRGMLLPPEQIDRLKAQMQQARKAAERWTPIVAQWQRTKEGDGPLDREAMATALRELNDQAEMFGLEQALWQQVGSKRKPAEFEAIVLEVIAGLEKNPSPVAAHFLARQAVFADSDDVRKAATAALKPRPWDHFVPLLLSGLQSPLEGSVAFSPDAAGNLSTRYTVMQEGPFADLSVTWSLGIRYVGTGTIAEGDGSILEKNEELTRRKRQAANVVASAELGRKAALGMQATIDSANRIIESLNARIIAVLTATTAIDRGKKALDWWAWWFDDHNELHKGNSNDYGTSDEKYVKPEYDYEIRREVPVAVPETSRSPALPFAPIGPYASVGRGTPVSGGVVKSCFARGTPVWTLTGLRPIEEIAVGDRVLSQDAETGELSYKPVLQVTRRPPGPRVNVSFLGETIAATPGHPFWVVGQNWRLAKELEQGQRLHALGGAVEIEGIENAPAPESMHEGACNLVVADSNSYFVGRRGVLVHDNTPRRPTAAPLPGLAR